MTLDEEAQTNQMVAQEEMQIALYNSLVRKNSLTKNNIHNTDRAIERERERDNLNVCHNLRCCHLYKVSASHINVTYVTKRIMIQNSITKFKFDEVLPWCLYYSLGSSKSKKNLGGLSAITLRGADGFSLCL